MTIRNGGHFIINSEYIMISEDNIKKRISVLDTDIQKVSSQIQELDRQKQDAVALMNALNGAKQQCISFLKDLNDDEPDDSDSGDVGNNADSNIPQNKKNVMGLI
tara:strand:- start:1403 stop:1717 length:315 start_codon:yes stop_codon:yes gene_type:complete